jgi:hypothetical protein
LLLTVIGRMLLRTYSQNNIITKKERFNSLSFFIYKINVYLCIEININKI